jgi:hypothetical protein
MTKHSQKCAEYKRKHIANVRNYQRLYQREWLKDPKNAKRHLESCYAWKARNMDKIRKARKKWYDKHKLELKKYYHDYYLRVIKPRRQNP